MAKREFAELQYRHPLPIFHGNAADINWDKKINITDIPIIIDRIIKFSK